MINVSNVEFLTAIFGDEWGKAHVTAFDADPADIKEQKDRMIAWSGGFASNELKKFKGKQNQYYTISLFNNSEDPSRSRRRKKDLDACFVIVADDVSEKLPVERVELLPKPSFKLFSSEHSEQWGWILKTPEENSVKLENLLDGLVKKGLAPDGVDPGMKGVTRYVRLPEGYNTKAKRFINGEPFKCYLSEWHPERLHDIDVLAATFDIDLYAPRAVSTSTSVNSKNPIYANHPIWNKVNVTGVNDEWTLIDCPNAEHHTGNDPSGAAVLIRDDGSVAFQCHHGHCSGDAKTPKITGLDIGHILGINKEIADYVLSVNVEAGNALAESLGREISTAKNNATEANLIRRDDDEFNILRYVYIPSDNSFFDVCTGAMVTGDAIDKLYIRTMPGGKEHDKASQYFHKNRSADLNIADGIGWVPWSNKKPSRDELIVDFSNKRLVNSWDGLQVTPVAGDASPWLDHLEYLLPNDEQRINNIRYQAFILQRPEVKVAYTIMHRGSAGVGKDLMLVPLARAFGHEASGSVKVKDLTDGWGDYLARKKFLIVEEVDSSQRRSVNNALKTLLAPTATGVRTLNIKGGGVVTQMDCLATYMMSNKKNPISLEKDDRRYYVVDSFIQKKEPSYYADLDKWLKSGGIEIVIDYLLNLDLSDFNPNVLPAITSGMIEMQENGKYDYEITIEELIAEQKGCFVMGMFTLNTARQFALEQGVNCISASLIEAIENCGYTMLRGIKKIDGNVKNSPKFFVLNSVAETLKSKRDIYEYWEKYRTASPK